MNLYYNLYLKCCYLVIGVLFCIHWQMGNICTKWHLILSQYFTDNVCVFLFICLFCESLEKFATIPQKHLETTFVIHTNIQSRLIHIFKIHTCMFLWVFAWFIFVKSGKLYVHPHAHTNSNFVAQATVRMLFIVYIHCTTTLLAADEVSTLKCHYA